MAERTHAEGDQVIGAQLRQDLGINVVVAKRPFIAFEAEIIEPSGNLQQHRSNALREELERAS